MSITNKKVDWSKVGRRVKRRGKTYERRVATLLTEFTGVNFRSTPGSGGYNKQGGVTIREELFCGDLIADRSDFLYCIEAKNREIFDFNPILKNPETAAFTLWWYQCVQDAKRVGLEPLMFFKPNGSDDFIVITVDEHQKWLNNGTDIPYFILEVYQKPLNLKIDKDTIITTTLPVPVIMDWKAVAKIHDPKTMFRG